tara:strand:- start:1241 stop:1411 length:171 start_codon:yes stop_codon:yes gene_type:complete
MKVKIITDRGPFVDGVRAKMGDIVDVSAEEAKMMMSLEFAMRAEEKPTKTRKKKDD